MKKIVVAIVAVAFVIIVVLSGAWYLQDSRKPYAVTPEPIMVGSPPESSALVHIADDQHFFAENGLNVTIKEYDTGLHAVNDMIKDNNPEIAVAAEYIIVGKAFEQEKIVGVGTIAKQDTFCLIGRKDCGIENVSDSKEKRSEWLLGQYPDSISADISSCITLTCKM